MSSEAPRGGDAKKGGRGGAGLWLALVFVCILGLVGVGGAALTELSKEGRLVAPPLTATDCLDEKLAVIRESNISQATLIGVGSSAAWVNFAPPAFERAMPGERVYNAAHCLLHVNQTLFWTDFILDRTPDVRTVVYYISPRDFEDCNPNDTRLFDPELARLYLDKRIPGWALHLLNFRWHHVLKESGDMRRQRSPWAPDTIISDRQGWSPLRVQSHWMPPPKFDDRCFAKLTQLEARISARGRRLVVAAVPLRPTWKQRFDPDGAITRAWIARVHAALSPRTPFIDGSALPIPDSDFSDAIHLLLGPALVYSTLVAERAAAEVHADQRADGERS